MAGGSAPLSKSGEALRHAIQMFDAKRFAEAETMLARALDVDPANNELLNARGVALASLDRRLEAILCFRQGVERNPEAANNWTNFGRTTVFFKQFLIAAEFHRRASALSPADARIYHNLGIALARGGSHREAILAQSRALDLDPQFHLARWDRAMGHLVLGDYRQGWSDYEARFAAGHVPPRTLPGQRWTGAPYPGKRLLVLSEQGLGDGIWASRYLRHAKSLGGELIVECRRESIDFMALQKIADRLIPYEDPLPPADYYIYQCSLPGLFANDPRALPPVPYLEAPRDRMAKFGPALEKGRGRFKVGIVWSGNVDFRDNKDRAQTLGRFLEAFALPGVQLYSLQKGPPEKQLAELPSSAPIVDLAPLIGNFADTAAAVAQLDLVIMTDSSVAHLAAALGKPVWVLLGRPAYWLWLLDRSDSPWYPTLRLFRPRAGGDWNHVFDMAALELLALAWRFRAPPPVPPGRQSGMRTNV
ncbi:MAG TPA: glycosyltransferase family 9 protein [Alphaproteobacteria bacterium]|nr:glycosyltransferase family 9 protein [Alphaproteobacteria bacterium]